uniref:Uncharacterized protein n=1 Tax=Lygus hesperus TaxID=30085 RepID=A0A0A9WB46_LYGHE
MVSTVTYTARAHDDIVAFTEAHEGSELGLQSDMKTNDPIQFSTADNGLSQRILAVDTAEHEITQQHRELLLSLAKRFQEYKNMYVATVQKAITTPVDLPATLTTKVDTVVTELDRVMDTTSHNLISIGGTCNSQRRELLRCYHLHPTNILACQSQLVNFSRCSHI